MDYSVPQRTFFFQNSKTRLSVQIDRTRFSLNTSERIPEHAWAGIAPRPAGKFHGPRLVILGTTNPCSAFQSHSRIP